jgi:hypothetical protein
MTATVVRRSVTRLARALLWLAAVAVLAVPFASPGSPVSLVHVAMNEPAGLVVTGDISGLAPGVAAVLTLTVHNPSSMPATVSSLTTRVTGGTGPCRSAALSVQPWSGRVDVPSHSAVTVTVPVTMPRAARSCAGTSWQLRYTAA